MTLPRETVVPGLAQELEDFSALLRTIDEKGWATPTRCEGWSVADVAAHVVGTMADVVSGRVEGLGTPEVTAREVEERRGRTPAELADELDGIGKVAADVLASFDDAAWNGPSPGGFDGTLGWGVETLWYDTFVHANDIRAALGQPAEGGPGIDASLHHIADALEKSGWGPATIAVDGHDEVPVGKPGDGDRRVSGDPLEFILAATGRSDPARLGLDESVNIYR